MTLTKLFYNLLFGKLYFAFGEEGVAKEFVSSKEEEKDKDAQDDESKIDISYLQSEIDKLRAERDKYKNNYLSTKKRAEKAETKAKDKVSSEELDTLKQQLEINKTKLEEREQELQRLQNATLRAEIAQAVAVRAPELAEGVAGLLPDIIKNRMGIVDGQPVVLTETGTPKLSAKTGKPMTAKELVDDILAQTPTFLRAKTAGGTGASGNSGGDGGLPITKEEYAQKSSAERAEIRAKLTPEQLQQLLN